ncbi:KaiA family protein [Rippkaea orientalis PCC 8801]|uniref:Circadian clock oscillator protein KaiA n=1 Tax=Rippkaea orientalis (strain PCC 8801 / RF-1) TaxID=41431 RepID=B7K6A4_RIPO1|nr:circadian clock protein KaiA [Rippkaea orientalis]ACK68157.1 KaiA family protein [Rippkaea orientalis PCC 8801]
MSSRLSICLYISDRTIAQNLAEILADKPYCLKKVDSPEELLKFVESRSEQIDCLIIFRDTTVSPLFNQLYEQGTLLPVIILDSELDSQASTQSENMETATCLYHTAEVRYRVTALNKIESVIEEAIAQFLHLSPSCSLANAPVSPLKIIPSPEKQPSFLLLQQRRLAEKLKERLGYLGVYYKRNPKDFYRNLSPNEKKQLIAQLRAEYREIILNYFGDNIDVNQLIDQFVNQAFFSDISVSKVLEIHMELMDEFSQQLKLEGRSEEILLDYRLTIIDILAHLGEMYRRSIPREDILFDLLYQID